jgi:hypothetical protein
MKNFFLFAVSLGLAILLAPIMGNFYEAIIGHPVGSSFIGPANPEYTEGFVIGFVFLITFLLYALGTSMKNYVIVFTLIPFIVLSLFVKTEILYVNIAAIIIALLLAKGGLLLHKKFKKL